MDPPSDTGWYCSRLHVLGWLGVMTPKPCSRALEGLDTGQIPRKMLWELMLPRPALLLPLRVPYRVYHLWNSFLLPRWNNPLLVRPILPLRWPQLLRLMEKSIPDCRTPSIKACPSSPICAILDSAIRTYLNPIWSSVDTWSSS